MVDKTAAKKAMKGAIDYVQNSNRGKKWKDKELKKLALQYRRLTGEWEVQDLVDWQMFDGVLKEIAEGKKGEHLKLLEKNPKAGAMNKRSSHIPGYAKDPGVYEIYQ